MKQFNLPKRSMFCGKFRKSYTISSCLMNTLCSNTPLLGRAAPAKAAYRINNEIKLLPLQNLSTLMTKIIMMLKWRVILWWELPVSRGGMSLVSQYRLTIKIQIRCTVKAHKCPPVLRKGDYTWIFMKIGWKRKKVCTHHKTVHTHVKVLWVGIWVFCVHLLIFTMYAQILNLI